MDNKTSKNFYKIFAVRKQELILTIALMSFSYQKDKKANSQTCHNCRSYPYEMKIPTLPVTTNKKIINIRLKEIHGNFIFAYNKAQINNIQYSRPKISDVMTCRYFMFMAKFDNTNS